MNELIKALREISPVIWEATVRQMNIAGKAMLLFGVVLVGGGIVSFLCEKHLTDQDGRLYVLGGFAVIIGLVLLVFGVMYLINPEYWAIMQLKP